jgi:DNA-binding MarR family transcriptional regulator
VDRLERRELVARHRADHDARVVLRETLSELSDSDIAALLATGDVFERFIDLLQSKVTGR